MKNILVLGATGGTGRQVVAQAAQQGHRVTALVRDPSRAADMPAGVRAIPGDLLRGDSVLDEAMRGQDAVISALGVGTSFKPAGLIARSVPFIVQAMERQGVRRLIFTSAYGVGETWADVPFVPRLLMRLLLREVYADKASGDALLRRSGLEWTLVYPATLSDGPKTGKYRVGERLALRGVPRISRADLADFLLAQVADPTYVRKSVLVSA